jgi:chorismate--pyruvate lyase
MRAMIEDSHWLPQPPALSPALLGFVTEPGSLTERLLATGHRFAVQPQPGQ